MIFFQAHDAYVRAASMVQVRGASVALSRLGNYPHARQCPMLVLSIRRLTEPAFSEQVHQVGLVVLAHQFLLVLSWFLLWASLRLLYWNRKVIGAAASRPNSPAMDIPRSLSLRAVYAKYNERTRERMWSSVPSKRNLFHAGGRILYTGYLPQRFVTREATFAGDKELND